MSDSMRDVDLQSLVRELEAKNLEYLRIIRDRNRIIAAFSGKNRCPHDLIWGMCGDPTCALLP
jgi:hypothetical protein